MRKFIEIYDIAAERKGGASELDELIGTASSPTELSEIPHDRWLAQATKCVFQAGFNWKVVESMWSGFEEAFDGFDLGRCAMLNEEDFDRLVSDTRIVRYGSKIRAVQENAQFMIELVKDSDSVGQAIANWPAGDYIGLLAMLKKRGSRLGGNTGQYFLRFMGKDSFTLSRDVVARLIAEGVVDKAPTSKKAMVDVQAAFNTWMDQSGLSLTQISRVLAMSV